MKKIKIYTLTILFFLGLQNCGTIKEGFSKKKNSSEEFLIEKKSPLIMPPDFDKLPIPQTNEIQLDENSNSIKSLITSNEDIGVSAQNNEANQNLENSILKKIKNN